MYAVMDLFLQFEEVWANVTLMNGKNTYAYILEGGITMWITAYVLKFFFKQIDLECTVDAE